MMQDAILSFDKSEVERPLQMYLDLGDVSKILLAGLELLAEVHPVIKGQLPITSAYDFPSKLYFFQRSLWLSRPQ